MYLSVDRAYFERFLSIVDIGQWTKEEMTDGRAVDDCSAKEREKRVQFLVLGCDGMEHQMQNGQKKRNDDYNY